MMSQTQIHSVARQMFEQHGQTAIAQAAQNAQASERRGDADGASEWRQVEAALKELFPEGTDGIDLGTIVEAIIERRRRQNSSGSA